MEQDRNQGRTISLDAGPARAWINKTGDLLVEAFHFLGLFAIGAATDWAAGFEFFTMVKKGTASVEDLLLLFIYLEIGAMVGIYFKTNHMPVRFLIYVAITALTRHLVGFVNAHHKPEMDILVVAGGIFILAASVLALRYGSYKYPSDLPRTKAFASDEAGADKYVRQ